MSLRGALESLPDDRTVRSAARSIASFLTHHPNERIDCERISRASGVSPQLTDTVLKAFAESFVIDFVGSGSFECIYTPSTILSLEIDRFLRSSSVTDRSLRDGTERFRKSYGR